MRFSTIRHYGLLLVLPVAAAGMSRAADAPASQGPWQGYIYVDLDGKRGAERAIKLTADGKWELQKASRSAGLYDVKLAAGVVGQRGELDGLPADAWAGAKAVWKIGTVETRYAGKEIPTLAEIEATGIWK